MIETAGWITGLDPEAGNGVRDVAAARTPPHVAEVTESHTGRYRAASHR